MIIAINWFSINCNIIKTKTEQYENNENKFNVEHMSCVSKVIHKLSDNNSNINI